MGRTGAFADKIKDLVGRAEFGSRAQLLKLSKSFFEPAQAPDARLEGALEMLAAVVQEPAVPAVADVCQIVQVRCKNRYLGILGRSGVMFFLLF